jgi:hypothetical protein
LFPRLIQSPADPTEVQTEELLMPTTINKPDTRKTVQDASDASAKAAKAGTNGAAVRKVMEASSRDVARKNAEAAERTLQKAAQGLRGTIERSAETASDAIGASREMSERTEKQLGQMTVMRDKAFDEAVKDVAGRTQQNLNIMMRTSAKLADGFQSVMREWADYTRNAVQCNIDGMNNIMRARTPQDMMAAQSDLLNAEMQVMLSSSVKIAEATARFAKDAS